MPNSIQSDAPLDLTPFDACEAHSTSPEPEPEPVPVPEPGPMCTPTNDEVAEAEPDLSSLFSPDWAGDSSVGQDGPSPALPGATYQVVKGDTLSKIAARNGLSLAALETANPQIADPDVIEVGQRINIPGAAPQVPSGFSDAKHASFPTSDGYPIYRQGDAEWRDQQIGTKAHASGVADGNSIWAKGCALSSAAMALSGISGQTVTPGALDTFAKSVGAMDGNSVEWSKLGAAVEPPVTMSRRNGFTAADLATRLASNQPVAIGVHYSGAGSAPQHWLLVTGRSADGGFRANDPASGKVVELRANAAGQLVADAQVGNATHHYRFTGDAVTFG